MLLVSEMRCSYNYNVLNAQKGCEIMINDNVKYFRKAKGISQEEMAVKLNVVRQTVSKWENGLSVPDADVLIHMADLLDVSVSQLLGVEIDNTDNENLSEELAKLNEQLAKKNQKEKLQLQANKKRGLILGFSFLAMLIALLVENEIVSILLVGVCTLMALVSCVILFAGLVSPKLPFSRHTGLRLPWTVQDEDTWNITHRIVGYISLPVVLLYIACTWTISNFEMVTLGTMIIWIGIPGAISYIYFHKKFRGNLK